MSRKTYTLPSYRLPLVAEEAECSPFAHHDALADAVACAEITIDCARRSGADDVHALAAHLGVRISQIAVEPVVERAVA
jgi:DNA polymerase-3 subunit epsilon